MKGVCAHEFSHQRVMSTKGSLAIHTRGQSFRIQVSLMQQLEEQRKLECDRQAVAPRRKRHPDGFFSLKGSIHFRGRFIFGVFPSISNISSFEGTPRAKQPFGLFLGRPRSRNFCSEHVFEHRLLEKPVLLLGMFKGELWGDLFLGRAPPGRWPVDPCGLKTFL